MGNKRIEIKPLSVNEAWQGKRFKTKKHEKYRDDLALLLPNDIDVPQDNIGLNIVFGISKRSDIDNPIKSFLDCLSEYYGFNDSKVVELNVKKDIVKKGKEYIEFEFYKL